MASNKRLNRQCATTPLTYCSERGFHFGVDMQVGCSRSELASDYCWFEQYWGVAVLSHSCNWMGRLLCKLDVTVLRKA